MPELTNLCIQDVYSVRTLNYFSAKVYTHMIIWTTSTGFNETKLPPREAFYNTLTESDIGEEDYDYALKIWNAFKCETMYDFHTLYMKCDVALICDVFEHFCKIAHSDYKLDPKYYITLPSFSFDAMLKLSRVELELLTCPDAYLFLESAVRGGISVISNRYARSNNPLVPGYDVTKPTSYIGYYDANNFIRKVHGRKTAFTRLSFPRRERNLDFWRHGSRSKWRHGIFRRMRHYLPGKLTRLSQRPSHGSMSFKYHERYPIWRQHSSRRETRPEIQPPDEARSDTRKQRKVHLSLCKPAFLLGKRTDPEESTPCALVHTISLVGTLHHPEYRTQEKFEKLVWEGLLQTHE